MITNDFYDHLFKKEASKWLKEAPSWHYLKAMAQVESGLKFAAISSVGASGLLQLMPATFVELATELKISNPNPLVPDQNVEAGALYWGKLYKMLPKALPQREKRRIATAAYNAGIGYIKKSFDVAKKEEQKVISSYPELVYYLTHPLTLVKGKWADIRAVQLHVYRVERNYEWLLSQEKGGK